ncbi:unnamed protein product, partial [Iphiclides podalirius]
MLSRILELYSDLTSPMNELRRGLFQLGKVLNFFPVGDERECRPEGNTLAKAGICLNPYDCRQRDGKASGDCAHGLGVCCVFEVTCGATVQNNISYFMSPGFPELWHGERDCDVLVEKTHAGVTQLRIDFVHFTIGQPNRTTGECDEDAMTVGEGANNFTVCGLNHGQHMFYDLPTGSQRRDDELPSGLPTRLRVRTRGGDTARLWMLRLTQLPLAQAAPHDCLQNYEGVNGTIKTFNYAVNGRHLASHRYRACIRQEPGFCAIRYWPCDAGSFRIGPPADVPALMDPAAMPPTQETTPSAVQTQEDMVEGSGDEPQSATSSSTPTAPLATRIWRFMWPSWMWGQRRARTLTRWSPYVQHGVGDVLRYYGYGDYAGRPRCYDRITIPCDDEYLLMPSLSAGVCEPHRCGGSFCPGVPPAHCRVDSSVRPFAVSVRFGPPVRKGSADDNIGACLRYAQLPCGS